MEKKIKIPTKNIFLYAVLLGKVKNYVNVTNI